jgi:hypothetical protein
MTPMSATARWANWNWAKEPVSSIRLAQSEPCCEHQGVYAPVNCGCDREHSPALKLLGEDTHQFRGFPDTTVALSANDDRSVIKPAKSKPSDKDNQNFKARRTMFSFS